jgi:hypothetical protein
MYCDTEKENNHIAGEEPVLLLVGMYSTYYCASGKQCHVPVLCDVEASRYSLPAHRDL